MHWRIICGLVALFVLANAQQSPSVHQPRLQRWTPSDNMIDIDVEPERNSVDEQNWPEYEVSSGSGSGMEDTDDEDLLASSGSGSGSGVPLFTDTSVFTTKSVTSTTTTPKLSECEVLRAASKHLLGNYVPSCNQDGDFASLQCHEPVSQNRSCWCADLSGHEIPGTALDQAVKPDCDGGTNLFPCVYELVIQSRSSMLGSFRPQCTLKGDFEKVQCTGAMCYCVDSQTGSKEQGTEVFKPDRPLCFGRTTPVIDGHGHEITLFPTQQPRSTPTTSKPEIQTKINVEIGGGKDEGENEEDSIPETPNETGDGGQPVREPSSASTVESMITQPGILAAVIGGSVVLLLCAILLAMFIVYRMRKKDEGSYALDEPKKMPNYSYQRAPDKEFYA